MFIQNREERRRIDPERTAVEAEEGGASQT
jgi:hypothetical protein